jgi:nitrate reductase gamma subunit
LCRGIRRRRIRRRVDIGSGAVDALALVFLLLSHVTNCAMAVERRRAA